MRPFIFGFVAAAVLFSTLLFVGSVVGGFLDSRITGCGPGNYSPACTQRKMHLQQDRQNQRNEVQRNRQSPC